MEMLSPHCRCFLHFACFRLFPSTPLHSGFVSYVGLVCVPRRERKKETVYLPPRLQDFYSSNPLKKWQKEIPIQIQVDPCFCRCRYSCDVSSFQPILVLITYMP
ncbi:hypothetical protein M431DRAFT_517258 [Trichoderma harzianum CBS 226.95]|uniref:Uncharacterized protein n=1 Tax=Trichoderma harzianum CBS 226.95 TaxID=983964 RepID=A0A2T4AKP3_TRIHA|nr:hypothetical protein M431DRAFT_517258 [Trichoderma harzianum CBS 226.95]PTB57617.1 hypothetical protein M431DRAFT_517258 [Trichoderma harzianum CBS 226.95]